MAHWQSIWINVNIAAMTGGGQPYGAQKAAAVAVDGGKIAWLGPMADLPGRPSDLAKTVQDCAGHWMTPGLIDCHTCLLYTSPSPRD